MVDHLENTEEHSNEDSEETPNLLNMEEKKAAKQMVKEWNNSHKDVKGQLEQWKVNKARSDGHTGVRLRKKTDDSTFATAYLPTGSVPNITGMNKASRLKRRLRATLFSDPAMPEAVPATDEDDDRDAAELSSRILLDLEGEGGAGFGIRGSNAFDLASDYGSGFVRFWVDEHGGGWKPEQMVATFSAISAEQPVMPGEEPYLRYVTPDGTLTDDKAAAELVWLPSITSEELTGKHVRFIPSTADDIWEAEGAMVGSMVPLGLVRRMFPDVDDLDEDELKKIIDAKPDEYEMLVPKNRRGNASSSEIRDETLIFVLTRYEKQCPDYPKGFYGVTLGSDYMAYRDEWYDEFNQEPLDIPITQFKQFNEEDNPYGTGVMTYLGPGNEVRAMMMGAMLQQVERMGNLKVFVPMNSPYQPQQNQASMGTYINIVPGGEPKYEQLPDFPLSIEKMLARVNEDLNDESGLQEAGQGLNSPSVQSGKHAQAIVEQVNIGLSDLKHNTERAKTRGWRIELQLVRAHYTEPQKIKWLGDDSAYRITEWKNSDLRSTKDVQIRRGSFTQLAPSAKAAITKEYADLLVGYVQPQEMQRILSDGLGSTIGLQEDPHRMRIRRQVSAWQRGPSEGEQPASPFTPLAVDVIMEVAAVRLYELGRAMASTRYGKHDPQWQQFLIEAFEQARQAAGVQTIAEQQQAQQAASEAQGQAGQAAQQHELAVDQQDQAASMQETVQRTNTQVQVAEIQSEASRAASSQRNQGT